MWKVAFFCTVKLLAKLQTSKRRHFLCIHGRQGSIISTERKSVTGGVSKMSKNKKSKANDANAHNLNVVTSTCRPELYWGAVNVQNQSKSCPHKATMLHHCSPVTCRVCDLASKVSTKCGREPWEMGTKHLT